MSDNTGLISDLHQVLARYGEFTLTKSGSLIAALELEGKDSDGLNQFDFSAISVMTQASVFQKLPEQSIITQYFIHSESGEVLFKKRHDPVTDRLTQKRAAFLNARSLSVGRIVMFIEIPPDEVLTKLGFLDQIKHLCLSPFSAASREVLSSHFSSKEIVVLLDRQMLDIEEKLQDLTHEISAKLDNLLSPRVLSIDETWRYMKFISNLDSRYLHDGCQSKAPESRFDSSLSDGDVSPVRLAGQDVIRLTGEDVVYASIYSVNNFGGQEVLPGMWGAGDKPPMKMNGDYFLMIRFKKNSAFQTSMMFHKKKGELDRQQFSLASVLSNQLNLNELEKRQMMKQSVRDALNGLDAAEALDIHWGLAHACAGTWAKTSEGLRVNRKKLKVSMEQSGFHGCWEGVGLPRAFKALQVAGFSHSLRNVQFNTGQLAAASLLYRSSEGQKVVDDLGGEEALYVFQTEDGSPFYFSPWVGARNLVIGVGPIRSGKSFTKNTLASHFGKYQGFLQGIDIDIGMEPVARLYGDQGGVFKAGNGSAEGFNPFVSCRGADDDDFADHLKSLILMMLKTNNTEKMQTLELLEQGSLDRAITATMEMPKHLQRLASVYSHCSSSLRAKFERWVTYDGKVGLYSAYFDAPIDSVGAIDKRIMSYNLMAIKDNTTVLPIAMSEIFYRVTRIFLDPAHRSKPKFLDIDECKTLFMSSPGAVERIVKIIRTMGKNQGGVGLWTQNVKDYSSLDDWEALRGAASTFFFMADPEMNIESYKKTFNLSDGECAAIQSLIPKKEAFIVQREAGIARKVSLEVDMEQYLVSTSKASDVQMREDLILKFGYEIGMEKAIAEMEARNEASSEFVA